jgi:hypothetical protein
MKNVKFGKVLLKITHGDDRGNQGFRRGNELLYNWC